MCLGIRGPPAGTGEMRGRNLAPAVELLLEGTGNPGYTFRANILSVGILWPRRQ